MQLNSRNQRTIIGKSQSTTDCDTSSEHEVCVENKGTTTSAKHVLPPSVNEKNVFSHNVHLQDTPSSKMDNKHNDDVDLSTNQGSTKCLNDKNKNEISCLLEDQFGKDYIKYAAESAGGDSSHWKHRAVWRFIEMVASEEVENLKNDLN